MKVVIIDYGLGNIRSIAGALRKLGHDPVVSRSGDDLAAADRLILPGVGAFGDGMKNLREFGLVEPLAREVLGKGKPILGICLGSQLMARESEEFGRHEGLGWFDASVIRIETAGKDLRIPHVGWDSLIKVREDVLFDGIPDDALFYYTHSYHVRFRDRAPVIGECEYGVRFTAAFSRRNIYGTQFHPEKSQRYGLVLLENFLTKVRYAEETANHGIDVQ
ncbi:MAG: imidazole glycerol phosphate synthase subunit HisH [Candidatus Omnitrophota bacterium]